MSTGTRLSSNLPASAKGANCGANAHTAMYADPATLIAFSVPGYLQRSATRGSRLVPNAGSSSRVAPITAPTCSGSARLAAVPIASRRRHPNRSTCRRKDRRTGRSAAIAAPEASHVWPPARAEPRPFFSTDASPRSGAFTKRMSILRTPASGIVRLLIRTYSASGRERRENHHS
jgi:hypothetical protein